MVGVIAALGWKVKCNEDLLDTHVHQLAEPFVAFDAFAKTGIGRDHEGFGAVHGRAVAARERVFAGKAQVAQIVEAYLGQIRGRVELLHVDADVGLEGASLRRLFQSGQVAFAAPAVYLQPQLGIVVLPRRGRCLGIA